VCFLGSGTSTLKTEDQGTITTGRTGLAFSAVVVGHSTKKEIFALMEWGRNMIRRNKVSMAIYLVKGPARSFRSFRIMRMRLTRTLLLRVRRPSTHSELTKLKQTPALLQCKVKTGFKFSSGAGAVCSWVRILLLPSTHPDA
jgi:hypothetical protein